MTEINWKVKLEGQAKKALKELPDRTTSSFIALLNEMAIVGHLARA